MIPPPIERYAGREQAYIKHFFLASYLESLVHKVGSRYNQIVYVDGFSGPWENEGSDYADTSFGIALQALRTARATWLTHGRDVKMKAVLVEKNKKSHDALLTLQPRYPDVEIKPFHADFRTILDQILGEIPQDAFAFVLLDPKGWRIPIATIEPLLRRPNTEVVFNFMFEFINRAASMSATDIVDGLAHLIHGMAGIRRRVSRKLLIAFTDRVSRPTSTHNRAAPHPPCPMIRPHPSSFQPSAARSSPLPSMAAA